MGLILFSALLISLSFHRVLFGLELPNFGFLAWFGFVPLFLLIYEATPRQAFLYGWITATLIFALSAYWLYTTLHLYGGFNPVASLLLILLLSSLLGLFHGLTLFLAKYLSKKGEMILILPVVWTALEGIRNYIPFGGWPWFNIAMSQSQYLPLIQIADITGVYGVTFLVIWGNVWLTECFLKWREGRSQPFGIKISLFLPKTVTTLFLFVLVLGYGFYRLHQIGSDVKQWPTLKVGLIQPNIPQDEKWEEQYRTKHEELLYEAVESLQNSVDLIIWPETAWFKTLWIEENRIPPLDMGITKASGDRPYSLLGLSFARTQDKGLVYYNSAALVDAQGTIHGKYHKISLIPFGEYVPLPRLFYFLDPIAAIGAFEPGHSYAPLSLPGSNVGVLICGEDIFPEISRKMVREGAHLLVNMTNDAWYNYSSEPYQHLALAAFRSIETRRTMVRATNTGISAVIGPTGKILQAAPLEVQSLLTYQAPLSKAQTLYLQLGDWFLAACFLYLFLLGTKIYVKRARRKTS